MAQTLVLSVGNILRKLDSENCPFLFRRKSNQETSTWNLILHLSFQYRLR